MRNLLLTIIAFLLSGAWPAGAQDFCCDVPAPAPIAPCDDTLTVFVIGDVMMHARQMEYGFDSYFNDISEEMKGAGLCIANMEFPLGGSPYSGYPNFSAPDGIAEYMASCGTDVFLTANNHILDRGGKGLERTLGIYDNLGILHTGTDCRPLIVDAGGFRLGIVNFTYGTNGNRSRRVNYMQKDSVAAMIRTARNGGAEFIIALPHWGEEYSLHHSAAQEEWAGWLAGQGVDIIVGAHPHVIQDTTHIDGIPVIYSVGNAVSNMSATNTRLELAVMLTFVRDMRGKRMSEPKLEFLWCTLPGMLTEGYATVNVKKKASRRSDWLIQSDYDNMMATLERVRRATGIVP